MESIIITAEDKKKKSDGINSVLKLMSEARDFQSKIADCIDDQSNSDFKSKIEQFNGLMDKMYSVLLDIAKTGIESVRQDRLSNENIATTEKTVTQESPKTVDQPDVVRVHAPSIPSMK